MAARGETRARVLETAGNLFSRQGFHATGVNQVLAESGAPKGSLYFHFPGGKEQLAVEAVAAEAGELGQILDTILDTAADPASAIIAMADLLAARLEDSHFVDGCPIATVALDVGADSDPIRTACSAGYDQWVTSIADYLTGFGINTDTASELALLSISSIEGALLLAKTQHSTAPLHRVAGRVAALVTQEVSS
ncbi:TetR/AcrR family transcriptional regulator [Rhodococcus sp. NPDC058521]|uniref:TetR/AcrR family transcriptional regulator n=1 Tax=Rhodococcus sp. NPDC058521 TaxID=3346536 RepID=UPI0036495C5A